MKRMLILCLLFPVFSMASVIGISNHPLKKDSRVLSAEMTGYMSQRNELGAGIRYSHQINQSRILDFNINGGQDSRKFNAGVGVDFELLREDIHQPRISVKSFLQHQKFESESSNLLGFAPTIRKGFGLFGHELFPYVATPMGIKVNNITDEFVSYASVAIGASMPVPQAKNDKLLLSLEGNKNLGASSDYIGLLISWIWK